MDGAAIALKEKLERLLKEAAEVFRSSQFRLKSLIMLLARALVIPAVEGS